MEMENKIHLQKLTMQIGAVVGHTLGLLDASQLENKEIFFNEDFLSCIPTDMVDEAVLMMNPGQQGDLDKIEMVSDINTTLRATVPEVDFVIQAWVSIFESDGVSWCEDFTSLESLMLAGEHLRQRYPHKKLWHFASKSKDDAWERFEVRPQEHGLSDLILLRTDFEASKKVYEKANIRLEDLLYHQASEILDAVRLRITNPAAKNKMSLAVIQGDQEPNTMEASIQLIPFIPISIGNLHNVVPIGQFFNDLREIIQQGPWEANFLFYKKLSQMFQNEVIRNRVIKPLLSKKVSWEIEGMGGVTLGESYDGSWTFFQDIGANRSESGDPYNYLTIEPVYHPYPLRQSMCGAMAAVAAQTLLCPEQERQTHLLEGWHLSKDKYWTERAFQTRCIQVSKGSDGLWAIRVPVKIFGEFICKNLDFIRAGSK